MKHTHRVLPLAMILALALLAGCATPAMRENTGSPTSTSEPRAALDSTAPLAAGSIVATSFIDADHGWAVGDVADGGGSLVQRTTDGGRTWVVLYADGAGFPLRDVVFTDAVHGWTVSSSGTLVGSIIATRDGGRTWVEQFGAGPLESVDFTDSLHGTVEGWDGDSPQRPITLETIDGGAHWKIRR
jgi:photosystem II stability/assembly factor-like uncharacterized protein